MSIRTQQVESTLKRAISEVIAKRVSDPRIVGLVSVTRVQVSPDLREAFVYVSVLPQQHESRTLHGLQSAAGRIQSFLRKAVALRTLPHLEFRLDKSIKKELDVLHAIRQASEREDAAAAGSETSQPADVANASAGPSPESIADQPGNTHPPSDIEEKDPRP